MSESQDDCTSNTAVAETKAKPAGKNKKKPRKLPPYHVVLLNDNDHSYEYVIEMLRVLFGHSEQECFRLAQEVDSQDRAIVFTTHKEHAEFKRDQIHAYGTDERVATCQGSMSATVIPAEEC